MTTDEQDNGQEEQSFADMLEAYSAGMNQDIQVGDKISGKIIAIEKDTVFLDTGTKIDGRVDRAELLDDDGKLPYKNGDVLELYVVSVSENDIQLSQALSGIGGLNQLKEASQSKIPIEGKVTATCKGGFHVELLKHRAFCPISQIDAAYVEDGAPYVGQTLTFLIKRFEEGGRNIVVSRREILNKERKKIQADFFKSLAVGQEFEGTVTKLMPFGVFVEIAPGVEGMVHISELSWRRVQDPNEVVQKGQTLRVKVTDVKPREKKQGVQIALSIKQLEGNPWDTVQDKFSPGDVVEGRVTRCADFGAFVEISPGIEGLVHISEMSYTQRVIHPKDFVTPNDTIPVMIKEIQPDDRRISLSIRDAEGDPWQSIEEKYPPGKSVTGTLEKVEKFGYFILLEPGITGLLPKSAVKESMHRSDIEKARPGDTVSVTVADVKKQERKISLSCGDVKEENDWQNYSASSSSLGSLGEKLQQALNSKK